MSQHDRKSRSHTLALRFQTSPTSRLLPSSARPCLRGGQGTCACSRTQTSKHRRRSSSGNLPASLSCHIECSPMTPRGPFRTAGTRCVQLALIEFPSLVADGLDFASCARLAGVGWLGNPAPLACNVPGTCEAAKCAVIRCRGRGGEGLARMARPISQRRTRQQNCARRELRTGADEVALLDSYRPTSCRNALTVSRTIPRNGLNTKRSASPVTI